MSDLNALAAALADLASSAAQRPPAREAQRTRSGDGGSGRPSAAVWADLEGAMAAAGIRERSRSPAPTRAPDLESLAEPPLEEEVPPPNTPLEEPLREESPWEPPVDGPAGYLPMTPETETPQQEAMTPPREETLEEIAARDEQRYYDEHCCAADDGSTEPCREKAEEDVGKPCSPATEPSSAEDPTELGIAEDEGYLAPASKARPKPSASPAWVPTPPPPPAWLPTPPPPPVRPKPRPDAWPGAYWRQQTQRYGARGSQHTPNVQWHSQRAKAKREGWLEDCRITGRMKTKPGNFSLSPKS